MSYATNTGYSQDVTNQIVASLVDGETTLPWAKKEITFSFDQSAGTIRYPFYTPNFGTELRAMSEVTKEYAREVLRDISAYCGLTFTELPSGADISMVSVDSHGAFAGAGGTASNESSNQFPATYGIVRLDQNVESNYLEGIYSAVVMYGLLSHEILHALGISHPFSGLGPVLDQQYDNTDNTVMSYTMKQGGMGMQGMRAGDILALQQLYGVNPNAPDGLPINDAAIRLGKISLEEYQSYPDAYKSDFTPYLNIGDTGGSTSQNYLGTSGNDIIANPYDYKVISGEGGIDTVIVPVGTTIDVDFRGPVPEALYIHNGPELFSIERIQTTIGIAAYDTDGTPGHVVKMLAAGFGLNAIDEDNIGLVMRSYVKDGSNLLQTCQVAVNYLNMDNASFVGHVYQNVIGSAPDAATRNAFVDQINNGTYTQASLLELAANYAAEHVEIVGSMLKAPIGIAWDGVWMG